MTFPQNTPSIDQLINLPAGEIAQLPVELLAALQREIDAAAKQMKAVTSRFSTALEVRYAARAARSGAVRASRIKNAGSDRQERPRFAPGAFFFARLKKPARHQQTAPCAKNPPEPTCAAHASAT